MPKKIEKEVDSIFDELFDSEEATDLKMRSDLMMRIKAYADEHELTQHELGMIINVPQSRVSDLLKGKIDKFSVAMLIKFVERLGMKVRIVIDDVA